MDLFRLRMAQFRVQNIENGLPGMYKKGYVRLSYLPTIAVAKTGVISNGLTIQLNVLNINLSKQPRPSNIKLQTSASLNDELSRPVFFALTLLPATIPYDTSVNTEAG